MGCHLCLVDTTSQVPHMFEDCFGYRLLTFRNGDGTTCLGLPAAHQWLEDHRVKLRVVISQQRKSRRSLDAAILQVGRQLCACSSFSRHISQSCAAMRTHHDEGGVEIRAARMLVMHVM